MWGVDHRTPVLVWAVALKLSRQNDHPPVRLFATGLRSDPAVFAQGEVDPAPLEGGHRLELEHLACGHDPLGGPVRKVAQLAFTPAAVILDVDEDARPLTYLPGEKQVDEMLEGRQTFTLAADEGAQGFLLISLADDVETIRLAALDLDAHLEVQACHELLEDFLRRGDGFGRDLRRLVPLDLRRVSGGGDFGEFLGREARLGAALPRVFSRPGWGHGATAAISAISATVAIDCRA
jgi:hypothetical protein